MSLWRLEPGACIVCGAAHCGCHGDASGRSIVVVPGDTSGMHVEIVQPRANAGAAPELEAERVQASLPPGQFTTATYRRRDHRQPRSPSPAVTRETTPPGGAARR